MNHTLRRLLFTSFGLALALCAAPAVMAATEVATTKGEAEKEGQKKSPYLPAEKLAKYQPTIDRLAEYLSNLTTIEADFTQASSDGSVGEGKFYLQRPGKMRWQYAPPVPILIVSSGNDLVYYDKELEQVSHIPIDSTLAGFLAEEQIRFDGAVGVEAFSDEASVIRITISQRSKPEEGKLTLEFSDKPLALRRMDISDATGQSTKVSLSNAHFGGKLNPKLFVFVDNRKRPVR